MRQIPSAYARFFKNKLPFVRDRGLNRSQDGSFPAVPVV
jgi:hypothetical protein